MYFMIKKNYFEMIWSQEVRMIWIDIKLELAGPGYSQPVTAEVVSKDGMTSTSSLTLATSLEKTE